MGSILKLSGVEVTRGLLRKDSRLVTVCWNFSFFFFIKDLLISLNKKLFVIFMSGARDDN